MATCFWQRCTGPTFMPCQEHQGIWCGRFRGRVIADLVEIRNDTLSREANARADALKREGAAAVGGRR